jgi:hypothetical protein
MEFYPHPAMLNKAAHHLGLVTIHWGWLEDTIDSIIVKFAPLEEGDFSRSITANAELRSKIQMARALAFLRKPSGDWFDEVLRTLDKIDNDLRPRRNNCIHGGWYAPKGRLIRRVQKTKLKRPQAFQLVLSTSEVLPFRISDLRKLDRDIISAFSYLIALMAYDTDFSSEGISFQQYLRWLKRWRPPKRGRRFSAQQPSQSQRSR